MTGCWTDADVEAELARSPRAKPLVSGGWWTIRLTDSPIDICVVARLGEDGCMPLPLTAPQYIRDGIRISPYVILQHGVYEAERLAGLTRHSD